MNIWKRPKALIRKVIIAWSIISLIAACGFVFLYYLWGNHPDLIKKIDLKLNSSYQNSIERLHTRVKKSKNAQEKYNRYLKLQKALQDATKLHKYYPLQTEAKKYIINYLLTNNKAVSAQQQAFVWQKNYPFDFDAKYTYAHVLEKTSVLKAKEYYQEVFLQHPDIAQFVEKYFHFLLRNNFYNDAVALVKHSESYKPNDATLAFMYYFQDNGHKKYVSDYKIKLFSENIKHLSNSYTISTDYTFKHLTKLRFDIDNLAKGSLIKNLRFTIIVNGQEYSQILSHPLHALKTIAKDYQVLGNDPYVEVNLPPELIGTEGKVTLIASFEVEIHQPNLVDEITKHSQWQLFYSQTAAFNEQDSKHFVLDSLFKTKINIPEKPYQFLRLDFPNFIGLDIYAIKFNLNKQPINMQQIGQHAIEMRENSSIKITGKDPYIIYRLNQVLPISDIEVSLKLGAKE